jgi:hypothetical protein
LSSSVQEAFAGFSFVEGQDFGDDDDDTGDAAAAAEQAALQRFRHDVSTGSAA